MVNAEDVQAYLDAEGVEIPRDRVRAYLIDITSNEAFLHPAAELAITATLIHRYSVGESLERDRTVTFMEDLRRIQGYPHVLFIGVLTRDWPGLADCVSGVVHEKGWNIAFLKGVTLRYGADDLGVILVGIKIEDDQAFRALLAEREAFLRDLGQVAAGSKAKSYLLTRQARKMEIYSQVLDRIKEMHAGEEAERLIGEDGEALKFFASRSNAYVLERTVDDLARQIITNYEFVRRARLSGGTVQIDASNIITTRERLTGITMAGFDRDLSLQDILDVVRKSFPGFQRKFNKEFSTQDGITLYRLEICDAKGAPADEETLERLRRGLSKVVARKKSERARYIESIGGFEHYARAIIPFLVKEHEATGRPQVFISAGQASESLQEFKVLMVLPEVEGRPDPVPQFLAAIDPIQGLGVVSTHPPKVLGKTRVEMIDVSADFEHFQEPEQIYALLKSRIADIIGEFRDFDEGMRRADRQNLARVQQLLPEVDEATLRSFYYHLDDFYRVSAPVEELAALLQLAVSAMNQSVARGGTKEVQAKGATLELGDGQRLVTATLLVVAHPAAQSYLRDILPVLAGYDCTMSKIGHENTTLLTFRVMKDHRPVPEDTLAELVQRIEKL